MKRTLLYAAIAAGCIASAAGGYWLGFRDAWYLGIAAESIPRAVVAVHQLGYLQSGRPSVVATGLEFDVDRGLIRGEDVFNHPLRDLLGPLWGLNVYPGHERYLAQLAAYRRKHPSLMDPGAFDKNKDLLLDAQETREKINRMVERYSAPR